MEYKGGFDINFSLEGKTALVTGAASGIGQAIAKMYALKGAKLILVDLSDAVSQTEKEIIDNAGQAVSIVMDITADNAGEVLLAEALKAYERIDILVNCAGIVLLDDAEKIPVQWWDRTMAVNLRAAFVLSQAIGNHMIEKGGGKIVNLASQASVIALDNHVAYCASKAALVSMTQVMATEWAQFNINVNAISPTVVLTELGKKA